jgi:3-oxoacyl-[acyl-carrier protein] reductase/2-hydroxycyclohexanecarboxyl-CoA dehydrogenase
MKALQNKIAIVTGASRGIGKGIVEALIKKGASVVMTDIEEDLGTASANEFRSAGFEVNFLNKMYVTNQIGNVSSISL